ncbi:MAG TPA: adventurous gliding motility protein CglE [Anaeromyxobacteraceae bacterium]|nr:adventurous gliding motility protein CglE [Anaeromyxobacteraceae bacterium]
MKRTLLAFALAAPLAAAAQEAAPALQEDPRAARYKEVERGFFVGFETGYLQLFDTPTDDPVKFPYAGKDGGAAGGLVVGTHVGVDLGNRLAFSIYALGGNQKASADYGAFSVLSVGGDLRLSLVGTRDRNGMQRLWVYVHGRGGVARTYPEGLFGTDEILVSGGPGIEYFTRLRHFSVGLAADYVYAVNAAASGFSVYPTVRYTF